MSKVLLPAAIAITLMASPMAAAGEHNSNTPTPSGDEAFQPIDLSKVEKVDGKAHATIAYGIIFVVFVLYGLSLLRRERSIEKNTLKLKQLLNQ